MLMSVMVRDAVCSLSPASLNVFGTNSLDAVLYADDTLLIGAAEGRVQELLNSIATVGEKYGMELHWSKFQLLQVNGTYKVSAPDGSAIAPSEVMTYLGAAIYADGGIKSELNRRIGAAWAARAFGVAPLRRVGLAVSRATLVWRGTCLGSSLPRPSLGFRV